MEERKPRDEDPPDSAEPQEAEELSEKVPEEVSGEGGTPLGGTDQHSDAPGETGTGSREPDPEHGKPARR
jgi:hypothetical protein